MEYPNMDDTLFLLLNGQIFYCVDGNGSVTHSLAWSVAFTLLEQDERFIFADIGRGLIVNWREVKRIDFANRIIFVQNFPLKFKQLYSVLLEKLSESGFFGRQKSENTAVM